MTRFKEKRRIERAIKHSDEADLQWALGYCRMRRSIATMKHHDKHWRQMQERVEKAIEELAGDD